MARIKVTGYLNTVDMDPEHVELTHELGLSNEGYIEYVNRFGELDDIDFQLER